MRYVRSIRSRADIEAVRWAAGEHARQLGFSEEHCGQAVLVCSELATNTMQHGGGGEVVMETVEAAKRRGLRMHFVDHGPGIDDVEQALTAGFTTRAGLGEGLPLARRLSDEFELRTTPGGTSVTVILWSR